MIQLKLPAEVERLGTFLGIVEQFAHDQGFAPPRIRKLLLVMEEALLNVVHYAYGHEGGEVEIRCWEETGAIFIEVRDQGQPFNPLNVPDPDLSADIPSRRVGGLGIFLIRNIADGVWYTREDHNNILKIMVRNT